MPGIDQGAASARRSGGQRIVQEVAWHLCVEFSELVRIACVRLTAVLLISVAIALVGCGSDSGRDKGAVTVVQALAGGSKKVTSISCSRTGDRRECLVRLRTGKC